MKKSSKTRKTNEAKNGWQKNNHRNEKIHQQKIRTNLKNG
jgi:hypothetical protein